VATLQNQIALSNGVLNEMKKCSYCGREEPDDALVCSICGTEFVDPAGKKSFDMTPTNRRAELELKMAELDLGFEVHEGFSRPDWKRVMAFIKSRFLREDRNDAWNCAAVKWLQELSVDLGGEADVYHSDHFFSLSDLGSEKTQALLVYAESVLRKIRDILAETAWTGYCGKHVLLLFSDPDDYYAYISFYYPEGTHALSGGVFIRADYAHVALPYADFRFAEHVLVHELVHNLLCHLPIPAWLNEGLAMFIEERTLRPLELEPELVERHCRHWDGANIQGFWAGTTFSAPGDPRELSYSLACILVKLLAEKKAFRGFVAEADWRDAGQDSALRILDCDLGEIAGTFLGPGNWRPQRKAIAEAMAAHGPQN
jgi:hypothetical protein